MNGPASPRLVALAATLATALAAAATATAQDPDARAEQATTDANAQATEAAPAPVRKGKPYFDLRRTTPIVGDAARGKSLTELCSVCHGDDGISIVPIYPDIAGQSATYMYWQMVKFKDAGFGDTVMAVAVEPLSDQDMRDLAAYYAGLPYAGAPKPPEAQAEAEATAPPDPALLARGEQLYRSGAPERGIPPCQGCHGVDAMGHPKAAEIDSAGYAPYAAYPALRGQRDSYLATRIAEYQEDKHTTLTTDFVMGGAAHRLDKDSVEALTTWLASLPR